MVTAWDREQDPLSRFGWKTAALAVTGVLLAVNLPLLLGIDAPIWDASTQYAPAYTLVADHARAGRFLLWNPWIEGGAPDGFQPELGAFSPLMVGIGLVLGGTEAGFRVYWLAVWLLGALGTLILARHLRAPPWAGAIVASGYLFSGFVTGHAEHTSILYAMALVPWTLWRLDAALSSGKRLPAVQAGVLWGLSGLGGYPGVVFIAALYLVLWTVGRVACRTGSGSFAPTITSAGVALVLLFAMGGMVLAPAYAGFASEAKGYTDRAGPIPRATAIFDNAWDPHALSTLTSPSLPVLKLWNADLWPRTDISMCSVYLGASVAFLALAALVLGPGERFRWWLVGLALLFVGISLPMLPFRGWLFDILPPARYFRHPALFKDFLLPTCCALAALASRDVVDASGHLGERARRRLPALACGVAALALSVFFATRSGLPHPGNHPYIATGHALLVWLGLAAAVLAAVTSRNVFSTALPAALLLLAAIDGVLTVALSRQLLFDRGTGRSEWDRIARLHEPSLDLSRRGWSRDLRPPAWLTPEQNAKNVPLRIPTLTNFTGLTNRFKSAIAADPQLARLATGDRRIWFSRQAVRAPLTDESFAAFAGHVRRTGRLPLLIHPREGSPLAASGGDGGEDLRHLEEGHADLEPIDARISLYEPGRLVFTVTAPAHGWLLVTDRWSRGWLAEVDGIRVEVWPGDFVFRALPLGAGPHVVRFAYQPFGYPWLLILSWGAAGLIAIGSAGRPLPD